MSKRILIRFLTLSALVLISANASAQTPLQQFQRESAKIGCYVGKDYKISGAGCNQPTAGRPGMVAPRPVANTQPTSLVVTTTPRVVRVNTQPIRVQAPSIYRSPIIRNVAPVNSFRASTPQARSFAGNRNYGGQQQSYGGRGSDGGSGVYGMIGFIAGTIIGSAMNR